VREQGRVGVDVDRVADGGEGSGEGFLCGHQLRLDRPRDSFGLGVALHSSRVNILLRSLRNRRFAIFPHFASVISLRPVMPPKCLAL